MLVEDNQIKIDLHDLVDIILSRVEPVEIAEALWQNEEVRDAFIYKMTERYSSDFFTDTDRRKFLTAVKQQIHDKSNDVLSSKLASIEYNLSRHCYYWQEIENINRQLRDNNVTVKRSKMVDDVWTQVDVPLQFNDAERQFIDESGVLHPKGPLATVGKIWSDANHNWRKYVDEKYPPPVEVKEFVPIEPAKVVWTDDLYRTYDHFGISIPKYNTIADLLILWKGILSGVIAGQEIDNAK